MRKLHYIIVTALTALVLFSSCASSPQGGNTSSQRDGLPDIVRNARRNAPENVLIGIGSAKLATQNQSRTVAETRARAEISRAMDSMMQDMVRDYVASSEVAPNDRLAFQENITVALSRSRLQGAVINDEAWIDGTYYVVMYLNRTNVVREINQAQAAARLAVPAMASFNAESRMNAAFDREYARELGVADRD
ncbi:MAG: hypothetical protein FWD28_09480 [Treponema sp.]|nr:hypothetical protein [Treponema sp.]